MYKAHVVECRFMIVAQDDLSTSEHSVEVVGVSKSSCCYEVLPIKLRACALV